GPGVPVHRRVRLGPCDQALEQREPAEHAAGLGVLGDDRVLDAEAPQRVAGLQRSRTASHDEEGIPARRKRPGLLRQLRHRFAVRSRRAWDCSIRYTTWGWFSRNGSTSGADSTRHRTGPVATTSATGGSPSSTDTSPKYSPRPRRARSSPSMRTETSPS